MAGHLSAEELFPQLFLSDEAKNPDSQYGGYYEILRMPFERLPYTGKKKKPENDSAVVETNAAVAGDLQSSLESDMEKNRIREHEATAVTSAIHIEVIGSTESGKVKIFSKTRKRIIKIPDTSKMRLHDLLGYCGGFVKDKVIESGDGPMFTMGQVRDSIKILAERKVLIEGHELGVGCWSVDGSVVLVGANEAAIYDGTSLKRIYSPVFMDSILDFETPAKQWYDFDELNGLIEKANNAEWRNSVIKECIELFRRWKWKSKISPTIATGLVLASWIQTMWEWRPQVILTGKSSTGKSMLLKTLAGILGNLSHPCSDASPAGFKQMIKTAASVVLFDEFDVEDKSQKADRDKIMKSIRGAGRGDSSVLGTPEQKASETRFRHIIWLSGIQIQTGAEANQNRYISLELEPPEESERGKLRIPDPEYLRLLGQKLLAISVVCSRQAVSLASELKSIQIPKTETRVVESFSVPSSIIAVARGDSGDNVLKNILSQLPRDEIVSDENSLIDDILSAKITVKGGSYNVSMLIGWHEKESKNNMLAFNECRAVLQSHGIAFYGRDENRGIAFYPPAITSAKLLAETRWASQNISQVLRRAKGAKPHHNVKFEGSVRTCIAFNFRKFESDYIDLPSDDSEDSEENLF